MRARIPRIVPNDALPYFEQVDDAWVKYRDRACESVLALVSGASIAPVVLTECGGRVLWSTDPALAAQGKELSSLEKP